MSRIRWTTVIAACAVVASLTAMVGSWILDPPEQDVIGEAAVALAFSTFSVVGAVIVWRRPRQPIGWLFLAIGLAPVFNLADTYSAEVLNEQGELMGGALWAGWVGQWFWYPTLGSILVLFRSCTPPGRLRPLGGVWSVGSGRCSFRALCSWPPSRRSTSPTSTTAG
ncbi:MAG TPA: hypothetical protein VIL12_02510 [Acidimicrobiia bacterium]